MKRTSATPAEFERVMASLDPLDGERRAAVARLIFEVVGDCPYCNEEIRRTDPRRVVGGRLAHLICAQGVTGDG